MFMNGYNKDVYIRKREVMRMSVIMKLDSRCQWLLNRLMEASDYTSVHDIAMEKNVSKRSVYYDLCKINDWLDMHNITRLDIERNKGIFVTTIQKEMIANIIDDTTVDNSYTFSPMERIRIIICMIIYTDRAIYIEDLMNDCDVSRNTIFNDLKVVTKKIQEYDLVLTYEVRKGYQIQGDTIRKRAIFFLNFNLLTPLFNRGVLKFLHAEDIYMYLNRLKDIEQKLNMKYVDGLLLSLAALLSVMVKEQVPLALDDVDIEQIEKTQEYELVAQGFSELIKEECCYLCLHLLGSRIQAIPIDVKKSDKDKEVYELAKALVSEFKKIACVEFDEQYEVERSLFVHLKASLYRYRYGIQLGNPLIHDIVKEYPSLFEITKRACEYLVQQIGVPIPDAEIAYLTLHFGGFLRSSKSKNEVLKILIVCPNGISTGNMLKGEISSLLPNAKILDVVSLIDVHKYTQRCNLLISTVKIKSDVPVVVVHPILSDADRIAILKRSMHNASLQLPCIDTDALFHLVKKYVDMDKQDSLRKDIHDFLQVNRKRVDIDTKDHKKGLRSFLHASHIQVSYQAMTWQESLHFAAAPLLKNKSIEEAYIYNILTQLQYYGPYMFIAPNIVLAHAKPEDGCHHLDISMAIFKKDISFSPHHEAKIILVLSCVDQERHLPILRDIMRLFSIQTKVDALLQLTSVADIMAYIDKNIG